MAWYRTGTVNVTASSTTVTGSGTAIVANARVGDAFIGPDGRLYEISNVASDTAISILPAYKGSTASGQGFAIAPVQGYVKKLADEASELLNEYGAVGTAAFEDAVTSASDTTAGRLLRVGALRAQLGADVYGRGNILGAVSQSGGVPTGAVIQRGSNPNGEFTILADGSVTYSTRISEVVDITLTTSVVSGHFRSLTSSKSIPVTLIATNTHEVSLLNQWSSTNQKMGFVYTLVASGLASFTYTVSSPISLTGQDISVSVIGRGRVF